MAYLNDQWYPDSMMLNTNYQQPFQKKKVEQVNGRNGCAAYQMTPGSSVLLLDTSGKYVWCKTTDDAGFPTMKAYPLGDPIDDIPEPVSAEEQIYVTTKEFDSLKSDVKEMKDQMTELIKELKG